MIILRKYDRDKNKALQIESLEGRRQLDAHEGGQGFQCIKRDGEEQAVKPRIPQEGKPGLEYGPVAGLFPYFKRRSAIMSTFQYNKKETMGPGMKTPHPINAWTGSPIWRSGGTCSNVWKGYMGKTPMNQFDRRTCEGASTIRSRRRG